jgi:hypothetical protein
MKRLIWIGSSREDLKEFHDEIQDEMGHAPYTSLKWVIDIITQKRLVDWEALKSSKFEKLIDRELIEWFTQLRWLSLFLYFMPFRKNQKAALQLLSKILI